MEGAVFYSWQSDRPNRVCRGLIKSALSDAISQLNAELEEADRPTEEALELDHDTKGLPGSPDIAASILDKIEKARVFVADVTPIGLSDAADGVQPKHLPNPNVMIELGYAKRALGTDRVVQVWNTSPTGCGPADLPFDMRGKRGPIAYELAIGASDGERTKVLSRLTKQLKAAIEAVLASAPIPVAADRWAPSQPDDISIWPHSPEGIKVNEPEHGSGIKRIFPQPRSFVRILPARWSGTDDVDRHDSLLGVSTGYSWGATSGGILTYPGSILFPDTEKVHRITKRFPKTGEVWATQSDIAAKFRDHLCIRGDAIPENWAKFLHYAVRHIADGGGQFPFEIRLGVAGLDDLHWPSDTGFGAKPHAALESDLELNYTLLSVDGHALWEIVKNAWIRYRQIFSMPHPSMPEMQQIRFFLNAS